MKSLDMRFDADILKGLIGKTFLKYKCDAFDFTNSVTQIVGLYFNSGIYMLSNIQKTVDYFGTTDDIGVFSVSHSDDDQIRSAFQDTEMIETPVKGTISDIVLVNENQRVIRCEEVEYDIWLTRAIIFVVDGRELSFEKDIVPFSEEIIIRRGYGLAEMCSDEKAFLDGWDDDVQPECMREMISIKARM